MKRNLLLILAVVVLIAVGIFAFNAGNDTDDSSDDSISNETSLTAEDVDQNLGEEDEPEGALIPGGGFEVAVFDSCDIALEFNAEPEGDVTGAIKQIAPVAGTSDSVYSVSNISADSEIDSAVNTLVCRPATVATAVDTYQENLRYQGYTKDDFCFEIGILEEGCADIDGDIVAYEDEDEVTGLLTEGFSFIAHGKQYEISAEESELIAENSWQFQSTVESISSVEFISKAGAEGETIIFEF